MKKIVSFEVVALIVVVLLPLIGLFNNSYFVIHDDQHIARLFLLDQAIRQGDFYPRWVGGLGFNFGYPLFNFYPPLIYYVAEFFHLIGFDLLYSLKMMIVTGSITSAVGMYLLGKRYFDNRTGLFAATLHTFFFYRIITIYVRGAWAEFFAMSLLPFVFLGLDSLRKEKKIKLPVLFGLSLGFLTIAHPLIAFPTFFFIALFFIYYFILSTDRFILVKNFIIGITSGLGISAFFWLPSLIEKQYTLVNTILTHELANYKLHFIYPFQLWFSPWGYGGSVEGPNDGMSFQLGKVHIFLTLLSFALCLLTVFLKKNKKSIATYLFLVFLFIFSLFMSVTYSQFVWDKIVYLWYLQFPWRFLTFSGIFLSLIGGAGIFYLEKIIPFPIRLKNILLNFVVALVLIITIYKYSTYSKPHAPKAYDEKYTTSFEEISWRVSNTSFEFSPTGIKTIKTKLGTTTIGLEKKDVSKEDFIIVKDKEESTKITTLKNTYSHKEFYIDSKSPVEFRLNTFNFPGWQATLNNKEIKINDNNEYKLITVSVPEGKSALSFVFKNTLIRTLGNIISIVSVLILISYFLLGKRKK